MDIKCCNIALVYRNDEVDIILTDVETGRRALFYSNVIPYDLLMAAFRDLLVSCVNDICAIPGTFIFVGEWCYEQDVVLLDMDSQFIANFVKCKIYACYMASDNNCEFGVKFIDKCSNKEIYVAAANETYKRDTKLFVNNVRKSGYRGFNKNGDDYVIMGGNIAKYSDKIGLKCDSDLLIGTIDAIYSMMLSSILHQ